MRMPFLFPHNTNFHIKIMQKSIYKFLFFHYTIRESGTPEKQQKEDIL